jgi:exonuclease 3'-5' domain-containing protein 1
MQYNITDSPHLLSSSTAIPDVTGSIANMKSIDSEIVNTTAQVSKLVDWLVLRHAPPTPFSPTMYLDLEGINLCRHGSISVLTLLIDTGTPTRHVYLIDVHTLGARAFNTTGTKLKTLKDILQDEKIPKVFFDVRNDSDALFAHLGIALKGVEDVQLMENATRQTHGITQVPEWLGKLR